MGVVNYTGCVGRVRNQHDVSYVLLSVDNLQEREVGIYHISAGYQYLHGHSVIQVLQPLCVLIPLALRRNHAPGRQA